MLDSVYHRTLKFRFCLSQDIKIALILHFWCENVKIFAIFNSTLLWTSLHNITKSVNH